MSKPGLKEFVADTSEFGFRFVVGAGKDTARIIPERKKAQEDILRGGGSGDRRRARGGNSGHLKGVVGKSRCLYDVIAKIVTAFDCCPGFTN